MSFPRYEAYKGSGVGWLGEVPKHWTVTRLGYRYEVQLGRMLNEERASGENPRPYLRVFDVQWKFINTEDLPLMDFPPDAQTRYRLQPGDLMVNEGGSYVGRSAIWKGEIDECYYQKALHRLRPRNRSCDTAEFLLYVMEMATKLGVFVAGGNQTTIDHLTAEQLRSYRFAFPPCDEQLAIAGFLDRETEKIDALIAAQERLIGLLEEKRQAVISHAITKGLDPNARMKDSDVGSLGNIPAHWEVKRIKYLVRSIEQGWSPQCDGFSVDSVQEWGVLKVGCVNGGVFDPRENKSLPTHLDPVPALAILTGDLLISRANTRELVGSAAVAREDYPNLMLCDKLYRLRLHADICIPEFLAYFLGTSAARGQIEVSATGASNSMLNISQSAILEMVAPVPPVSEQKTIVNSLRQDVARFGSLTAETQSAIALLQERRSALVAAAVTGKIDVRSLVADKEAA